MHEAYTSYRWRLVKKAYEFFQKAEREQRRFTLDDLVQYTGYSLDTAKSYLTKHWKDFLTKHPAGDFTCTGLLTCPWEHFAQLHRQKRSLQDMTLQHAQTNQPAEKPHPQGWQQVRTLLAQLVLTLLALLKKQRGA